MYSILKANLNSEFSKGRFFFIIEKCLGLNLDVSEKSKLVNMLGRFDHECWSDFWQDTIFILKDLGYRSKKT